MKNTQRNLFYMAGTLLILLTVVRAIMGIATETTSVMELLAWTTLAFIAFSGGYLLPQFKSQDERVQFIKQKGLQISAIAMLVYLFLLTVGIQFDWFSLQVRDAIQMMIALMIVTIFSSWMVLSKRY